MKNANGKLIKLLGEQAPEIRIVDVGALWLGEGCQAYRPLLQTANASVVGFEPIAQECDALNRRFTQQKHKYLPYAIGDGKRASFHRCNFPMTSSLLRPDLTWMDLFDDLADYCKVESTQDIDTHRLDSVKEISGVDYLKLDVQGAELEVLRGASNTLQGTLIVQAEVEFVPIYCNQPLFAEIDQFFRSHGFMFHRFLNMEGRTLKPFGPVRVSSRPWNQVLWADTVYIRSILTWEDLPAEGLLKLAVILHEVYESFDYSAKLLQLYDAKMKTDYCSQYVRIMGEESTESSESVI